MSFVFAMSYALYFNSLLLLFRFRLEIFGYLLRYYLCTHYLAI